jgi:hypothetical protein
VSHNALGRFRPLQEILVVKPAPVLLNSNRIGLREITLLLIAGGFALLMMDVQRGAVVTGWTVVALWLYATVAGPRPKPVLTAVYGAGLFVTTFWWPREDWWHAAIALMWVGIGMVVSAGVTAMISRRTSI